MQEKTDIIFKLAAVLKQPTKFYDQFRQGFGFGNSQKREKNTDGELIERAGNCIVKDATAASWGL